MLKVAILVSVLVFGVLAAGSALSPDDEPELVRVLVQQLFDHREGRAAGLTLRIEELDHRDRGIHPSEDRAVVANQAFLLGWCRALAGCGSRGRRTLREPAGLLITAVAACRGK